MRKIGALICVALAACSTPYQEMGFRGGVSAEQITADSYRITASGNAYTGRTAIQDFTLLKAAETTRASGGTHFMIVSAEDASHTGAFISPGQATTTFNGNVASTTYSPAVAHSYVKPGQATYIRVLTIPNGVPAPQGSFDANEIIQFVGSRVARG